MEAKLIVVGGDIGRAEIPLKLPVIIGRGRDVSLTLPHPLVSRQHCEIFERDGRLVVRDLGSRNGTYVANEKITESCLPSGELLTIGAVTFRAIYDDPAAGGGGGQGHATVRSGGTVADRRVMHSDSVVPLSESELYRADDLSASDLSASDSSSADLSHEALKFDSGPFDDSRDGSK